MARVGLKVRDWNWRKIAYFSALILLVPFIVSGVSIFATFLAIIWIAASRTKRIAAWLAGGTTGR
jgi:hypothetical protein